MKIQILDVEGKKTKEIETKLFEEPIREDLLCKVVEAEKIWQPYSNKYRAGMNRSASGNIRRRRHVWKTDRGRGMARLPKKVMWRRGTQFSWEATIVPSTKGGRRAHPPKVKVNMKKINKKELKKALLSALTYTSSVDKLIEKYDSIKNKKVDTKLPLVVDGKILNLKTKEFLKSLRKVLGSMYDIAIQKKSQRAGKGTMRGRKYKKNAGLLLVTGEKESMKIKGVDVVKSKDLIVSDLASNGARLTLYTESAIQDLEKFKQGNLLEKPKPKIK